MRPFEYFEPQQLDEAIEALAAHGPDAALLAGGTDLLVMLKADVIRPKVVVNLKRVPGLAGIEDEDGSLYLGPLTTIREIETSALIHERFPALSEAAGRLGSVQIRHLATVGGNLCRAAPCAESAPPLMALDAQVHLTGPEGARSVPMEAFFTGPGETALTRGEVLTGITVSASPESSGAAYLRHSVRPMMDLAIVNVAAAITLDDSGERCANVRIVLGSVAPTPIRAPRAEQALIGEPLNKSTLAEAAELAAGEAMPITDVRGTDEYRRDMVRLFTRRALQQAWDRARGAA